MPPRNVGRKGRWTVGVRGKDRQVEGTGKPAPVEMTAREAARMHPGLDMLLWAARWLVCISVAFFLVFFAAAIIIPVMGETFLLTTGISAESTMAEVMAYWLVPQLFMAGMIGVFEVKTIQAFYRACRNLCDKLLLRRAARDAGEERGKGAKEAAVGKPKAGGTAGNGRPRGSKRDAGGRKDDGKRAEDAGSASGGCKDGENAG